MADLNLPHKEDVLIAVEAIKQENIELTWLEAATIWLEENSISESLFLKVLPDVIIENIKTEALENCLVKPSMVALNQSTTLDFLL